MRKAMWPKQNGLLMMKMNRRSLIRKVVRRSLIRNLVRRLLIRKVVLPKQSWLLMIKLV
jgi:hypothetical protein